MADNPITVPLPQDLPTNWTYGQTIGATGTDVGLTQQHGYNYLGQQVNAAQQAAEELGEAFSGLPSLGPDGKIPTSQLPDLDFLPLSGGTVTGPITLPGDPTQHLQAAPKQYVDTVGTNAAALIRSYPIASGQTVTAGQVVDVIPDIEIGKVVNLKESEVLTPYVIVHVGNPSPAMYDESCNGIWLLRQNIKENAVWYRGNGNVYSNSDVVNTLQGYLTQYDTSIQSAVNQVKIPYYSGPSTGVKTLGDGYSCKLFLLSQVELGAPPGGYIPDDGVKLSYFDSGTSSDTKRKAMLNSVYASWWTRSANTTSATYAQVGNVSTDGSITRRDSYGNSSGCRPALILPLSTKFNSDGTVSISDSVEYVVTTSGTPSQAIALQGGSEGDTIPVIFSGVAQLSGVTQGQEITSPGVQGFGAMDGWLSVFPYWTPGAKIATGNYTGTGSFGQSNPTTVVVPFKPLLVIISGETGNYTNGITLVNPNTLVKQWNNYDGSGAQDVIWSDNSVGIWDDSQAPAQLNNSGAIYYWVAIGY